MQTSRVQQPGWGTRTGMPRRSSRKKPYRVQETDLLDLAMDFKSMTGPAWANMQLALQYDVRQVHTQAHKTGEVRDGGPWGLRVIPAWGMGHGQWETARPD